MRTLLSIFLLCGLGLSGCVRKSAADSPENQPQRTQRTQRGLGFLVSALFAFFAVILLGALVLAGCVRKSAADSLSPPQPRTGAPGTTSPLIVTPENAPLGKVVAVNAPGRFVVLNFPLGKMAAVEQRLSLYRRGLKVGEVKVTGPQREDNIVADLAAGEAEVGDEARSQ